MLDAPTATGIDAGTDSGVVCGLPWAGAEDAATDGDAGDAGPGCNYTGEPTGTRTTLLALPAAGAVSLEDFDVDCSGIVVTTTDGTLLSCPIQGCAGAPTVISNNIPPLGPTYSSQYLVRIGLRGVVFGESAGYGDSVLRVYTLARDGSGVVLLQQLEATGNAREDGCADGFGVDGNGVGVNAIGLEDLSVANGYVFYVEGCGNGVSWTALFSIMPRGDACAPATNIDSLGALPGDTPAAYEPGPSVLVGPVYYEELEGGEILQGNAFAQSSESVYEVPHLSGPRTLAASVALVAWSGTLPGDAGGGLGAVAVCRPGATCADPVIVAGLSSPANIYADATTLYFTDAGNSLYACDAVTALAGSCTPKLLAAPAPIFTELRSDTANVYLLTSSSVVRIAK